MGEYLRSLGEQPDGAGERLGNGAHDADAQTLDGSGEATVGESRYRVGNETHRSINDSAEFQASGKP